MGQKKSDFSRLYNFFFPITQYKYGRCNHFCNMKKISCFISFASLYCISIAQVGMPAQQLVLTNEDSLNKGTSKSKTLVSGYGSAFYQRDFNEGMSTINLERAVLFVGHQFNSKISFFSELEIEDAKVGEGGGEIAME